MNESHPPPSGYTPSVPPAPPSVPGLLSSDERMWAMFGHLSALSGLLTGGIGNVVGPLIIWQMKKETMPFAAAEAREALNFNLSWLLWLILLTIATFVLMFLFVGILLIPVLILQGVVWVVFSILAGIKANDGQAYRYPLTLRFIS